jgi:hypothetical protein
MAGASYGCSDFLETNPQGALDEGTLANQTGVEALLIAAYRAQDWTTDMGVDQTYAASNWVWGSVTSDDAAKGTEATDFPTITDVELYNWGTGAADGILNNKWRGTYEGINRANSTIRLLDQVVAADAAAISQENQDRIRGEATFLRAFFHFEAYKMWGGVPYYTDADTTYRKPQIAADAVLDAVIADLDAAIGLLPVDPYQGQAGRATVWKARALKGKVQVYQQDWTGAIATLNQVVSSGVFALEPDMAHVWTGFESFSNGPETILAYQASVRDGEPNGENGNYGERLNFPHSGSPFGCCGFHQPTQNLVNYYQVDANGLPLSMSNPSGWNTRNTNLDAAASATMTLDPRLDWTVGRDGVPYKDWAQHEAGWIRQVSYGGPYSPKKAVYEDASGAESNVGWVATQLSSMNIHILRYADVLLLLAEAEIEGGSLDNARALINQIRTRAGAGAQGCGLPPDASRAAKLIALYPQCAGQSDIAVPINSPLITWADYEVGLYPAAGWTQAYAREALRTERRLELAMEGQRFFDLRRWGIAEAVINNYLTTETPRRQYLSAASPYASRHSLYPLPSVQLELSEVEGQQTLTQNPGW